MYAVHRNCTKFFVIQIEDVVFHLETDILYTTYTIQQKIALG